MGLNVKLGQVHYGTWHQRLWRLRRDPGLDVTVQNRTRDQLAENGVTNQKGIVPCRTGINCNSFGLRQWTQKLICDNRSDEDVIEVENRNRLNIGLGRNRCNQSYRENDKWRPGLEREKFKSESEKLEAGKNQLQVFVLYLNTAVIGV